METIFSLLGGVDLIITMIIVWSVVIALALLIEFLSNDLYSAWFAVGGITALISVPCGLFWPWQILIFFVVALACLLGLRRFVVKFIKTKTVPTNLDANVGRKFKLLSDVNDNGRSEIKINDITWTVTCDDQLQKGDTVQILGMEGNKYIVGDPAKVVVEETPQEKKTATKKGGKK